MNWSFLFHSVTKIETRGHPVVIMYESTRFERMPTANASKSTAAPKARKTRTRKAPAKKVTPVAIKATPVQQVSQPVKPSAQIIPLGAYQTDWTNRWNIHHYEMEMLVKDVRQLVEVVTPYYQTMLKQVKSIQLSN